MLPIFRNNSPYTVIILLISTMLLKLQPLMHPQAPLPLDGYFFYNNILYLLNVVMRGNAFAYTLLTVVMLFLQALYFKAITTRHKLYPKPTYLPALVFILLTSIYPQFNYFCITLLINWCLLGGMDIVLSFSQAQHPRKQLFNAGFIFCLAALLQFQAVGFLLVFFAGIALLRAFNPSEWVVGAMGYFTPFYFFAGIVFLVDKLDLLTKWPRLQVFIPKHLSAPGFLALAISGLVILFVCGFYAMQSQIAKNSVYGRRIWSVIIFYLTISLAVALLTDENVKSAWLLIIPASSMIITHGVALEKSKRFSNFTFYLFLVFVIACQLAAK